MAASPETPAQSPIGPGDTEPPSRPKSRGRMRLLIVGGVVIVTAALVAVTITIGLAGPQDPGEKVPQPHRAATVFPQPAVGQPRWAVPDHHWTALSKVWADDSPGPYSDGGTRFVSDGKRAIAFKAGLLTAYDGATGRQIWRRPLAWDGSHEPVAGDGLVIVPLHGSDRRFSDCVALDSATGAQRWREPACPGSTPVTGPVGTLWHGVFYHAEGTTITGVDTATGKRRYRRKFPYDTEQFSTPAVANGRIVIGGNWWSPTKPSTLHDSGIHLLSPDLKTDQDIRLSEDSDAAGMPDLLAVSGDIVLIRYRDAIWPVDARTGQQPSLRWTIPRGSIEGVLGRAVVAVTFGFGGPHLSGYDLLTGARVWSREPGRKWSSYDIEDGTLFALGDGVAIVDPTTGKTAFQRPAAHRGQSTAPRPGRAVPAGGHIVVFDKDGITGYR